MSSSVNDLLVVVLKGRRGQYFNNTIINSKDVCALKNFKSVVFNVDKTAIMKILLGRRLKHIHSNGIFRNQGSGHLLIKYVCDPSA